MAIDTMTIGSNIMCQLDVLSGFRQTLERLETFIVNSLRRRGRKDLVNILLKSSQVPFIAQYFSTLLAMNRCRDRSRVRHCLLKFLK